MKSKKQVPDGPHSNTQLLDLLHPEKVVKNGAGDKKGCEQRYYRPMHKVMAKPLIGPVPNWMSGRAVKMFVT